jgi:hypothetical protein
VTTVDSKRSRGRVGPSLQASVTVCAYTEERWPQTRMALDSIARQAVAPQEVIVVVDHNPALCERLEAEYPKIEVISDKFGPGLSGAPNTGVQRSGSWDAAIADCPRPRRRSAIPRARSRRGTPGEALA